MNLSGLYGALPRPSRVRLMREMGEAELRNWLSQLEASQRDMRANLAKAGEMEADIRAALGEAQA